MPWSAVVGTMISLASGTLGVIVALRGIATLAPAVAMRPQHFHRSLIERIVTGTARSAFARSMVARTTVPVS